MARILVVDDESNVRDTVRKQLERAGHEVVVAADGAEAMAMLGREPLNLVVADLYMPGMDGMELLVRLNQLTPRPTVLVMSGGGYVAREDLFDMARRLGAMRTLPKPFTPDQLLAQMREILDEQ